ncbi:hypothetical protein ABEB36_009645 [Hypothenemus hampei]|uniref:Myb-like domain-containing protein n=1 Tax=Hypothenemus hampei TaxID=57062 RepID=A0ABD1EHH2_HYPHA
MIEQRINWSNEEDEILIDFIRNHEGLYYNVKSGEYRKMQEKQRLWHEIGSDCSKRWAYTIIFGNVENLVLVKLPKKDLIYCCFLLLSNRKTKTEEPIKHLQEGVSQIHAQYLFHTNGVDEECVHLETDNIDLSQNVHSPPDSAAEGSTSGSNILNNDSSMPLRLSKKRKRSSTSEARLQLLQEQSL